MRPVIEKKGLKPIHIVYIVIAIFCVIAIGVAVYMQFFKDEKIGVIFGITDEEEDEEYISLKENFMNIFDNSLFTIESYNGNINKIKDSEDIILIAYDTVEETDNYTLNIKIPYFNINSDVAKTFNNEIKKTFKDKSESVIKSTGNENKIVYNVKYKAYVYKDIVSLIILSELKEGNSNQRIIIQSYNYNLSENRECTIDEILYQKQIDTDYANKEIEEEIEESQEQNIKLAELGYSTNVRDSKSDIYDIENADNFFIGENGYLYIVYAYGNTEFTSEMDVIIFR